MPTQNDPTQTQNPTPQQQPAAKASINEELVGDALLKTIKVPANLANLSSRLPRSNYQKSRKDDVVELVSITNQNNGYSSNLFDQPALSNRSPPQKKKKNNKATTNQTTSSDDGTEPSIVPKLAQQLEKPRPTAAAEGTRSVDRSHLMLSKGTSENLLKNQSRLLAQNGGNNS